MKKEIDVYEYAGVILKTLKTGVLITAKNEGVINPMTISWGKLGIEWNKLIFVTYVRTSRFTYGLLDAGEFTVNIPYPKGGANKILKFCGTQSGRDVNKVEALGLTLVEGSKIATPGIRELPLTLECKIIYRQHQDENSIPVDLKEQFYPFDVSGDDPGRNNSYHTAFFGEIVSAYILE